MTNRRQVIGAGLALVVPPDVGQRLRWRDSPDPAPTPVGRLLVDVRFADAVAMAAHATPAGGVMRPLERDLLGQWHDDLLPAVKDGRVAAFGGVTTETALFLIRTLAADHRLRVLHQVRHARPERGVIRHCLVGSAAMLSQLAGGCGPADWRRRFGQVLGACPVAGRPANRTVLTAADGADPREQTLVSWIIAASAA